MKRFFDFPISLWSWFTQVDQRFAVSEVSAPVPLDLESTVNTDLGDIRVVLWDVYGTMLGASVGDLERTLEEPARLLTGTTALCDEFHLHEPLQKLQPHQAPEMYLRDRYLREITDSHLRSLGMGIEYPEVAIETVWQHIVADCIKAGYQPPQEEPTLYTAYRWAYFFDAALQQNYLYPDVASCMITLKNAGIIQGIISNAQFYTPVHLRRLLRQSLNQEALRLGDMFTDALVIFSYELGFGKPNARMFHRAIDILNRQGITRPEILYVGNDMLNDVWTSMRAGIRAAFFAGDRTQALLRQEDDRCRGLHPDAIITQIHQVPQLILSR